MYIVKSFENHPIDSVTYVIANMVDKLALIIDPGTDNDERIINYLSENDLSPDYVFLTHEHFDHILGVNFLRKSFEGIRVISSQKTSERLSNSKKNLAVFYNQLNLIVDCSDIIITEGIVELIGLDFEVFHTPGHTDSSLSLKLDNKFFSGDFLLKGTRVVTNLPTGSKIQYQESIAKCSAILEGLDIYPGHGEVYTYIQH